ncbi:MAG: branched-chain amino acid ABC transporter ATP-binding protein [Bordetella sp. SCN 67-23]|nr:ABC transporter ATP-binding protein [Burkholderiales bacterium]ODS70748.1 MAG: branched-chain amino acid ABC transporter ATP-binding protein [Bordetella sp. SCN 67-23]ODU80872.1 MAG: branched-chain amino acid ABC transporter ATP-binding protein [Bordetella sp. SCN 68-11]OJW86431.1 MAG: branched-chain amino acid ABC transporter ATP-binding protein [Burkholderiales bacterium 67-32]
MTTVLQTFNLTKRFGGLVATNDVSITVERGARQALIGPNGAGKTTLINLLTGVLASTAGRIELEGEDVTRLPVHARARRGLVRTFQINQLFAEMTPAESLAVAISEREGKGWRCLRPLGKRGEIMDECAALMEQCNLLDVKDRKTAVLPYGKQRLLEIALALAAKPRVLLLDEPVAGVPDGERREILNTVGALPEDVTILLIEHDMDLVFSFANRISVLVNGGLFVEGTNAEIARDPRVKAVYLGEEVVEGYHD